MARRVCGTSRVDSTWPALAEVQAPFLDPSTSVGIVLATSTVRYESSTRQHPEIRGVVVVWEHSPRAPLALSRRAEICSWRLVCRYAITLPRKQNEAPGLACPCLKHHAPSVCSSRSGPYLHCVARTCLPAVLETFSDFPLVQCWVRRQRWRNQTGSCWKGTASIHYDIHRVPRRLRLTAERCVRTYTALAATGTLDSATRSSTRSRLK